METYFPRTVDKYSLFIMWELDEFAIFIIPVVFSFVTRQVWLGVILGFILMKIYMKIKTRKVEGFIFHWLWKNGVVEVKHTPPAYISGFWE